jgi:hypothetical protein
MIMKRDFFHQGLKYSFNWEPNRIKNLAIVSKTNQILLEYLMKIYKNEIPFDLFNDKNVDRISKFRLKGLPKGHLNILADKLIGSGDIIKTDLGNSKFELSELADKVYTNFKEEKIDHKPGHEPILKYILIKNQNAIAVEIPIWKSQPKITGHMDLILLEGDTIYIADYKPEGKFLHSLPQVAFYGLLLRKKFRSKNIRCIQFSKEECWEYDPEILRSVLPNHLDEKILKELDWVQYLKIC